MKTSKTILRLWEAEKYKDSTLTTEQMAMRLGIPHKVFLAKLADARMGEKAGTVIQTGAITTIELDAQEAGWSQWVLLQSDNHHDSILCNRDLEQRHLEKALDRKARVFIFGDLLDAMQGRFDPRRSMADLRPEYRRDDYYDYVVLDIANFLQDYAPLIGIIADGNHELAVLKNANTDLLGRLVDKLNIQGAHIIRGGYGG